MTLPTEIPAPRHDAYPLPGCAHCEALSRQAGWPDVRAYLAAQEHPVATA